jgi:hypothetical protein
MVFLLRLKVAIEKQDMTRYDKILYGYVPVRTVLLVAFLSSTIRLWLCTSTYCTRSFSQLHDSTVASSVHGEHLARVGTTVPVL